MLWGHQAQGLPPTRREYLRTKLSRQLGRHKFGHIDVVYDFQGNRTRDPEIDFTTQQVESWFKVLQRWKGDATALERGWGHTWQRLAAKNNCWPSVKGPLAATVAYLQDLDWTSPTLGPNREEICSYSQLELRHGMAMQHKEALEKMRLARAGVSSLDQYVVPEPKKILQEVSEEEFQTIVSERRSDWVVGQDSGYVDGGKELWQGPAAAKERAREDELERRQLKELGIDLGSKKPKPKETPVQPQAPPGRSALLGALQKGANGPPEARPPTSKKEQERAVDALHGPRKGDNVMCSVRSTPKKFDRRDSHRVTMTVLRTSVKNTFLEAFESELSPAQTTGMQRSCSCSDLPDDVFRSKSNADAGPGDPGETQTQSEQEQEEPEQGQGQEGLGGLFLGGAKASKGYRLVVKNTFVEVQAVQEDDTPTQLRRSLSDGDMQAPCDDTEGEAQREAQHEQCSPEPDQVLCLEAAVRSCERNAASHQPLQQPTQMVAGSMAAPMLSHAAYSGVPDQGFAGIASFAAALGASIALGVPFSPQLWAMQNMAAAQSVAVQAGSRMATGHEANAAEQVTPVKSRRRRVRGGGRASPKEAASVSSSSITPEKLEKPSGRKTTHSKTTSKAMQSTATDAATASTPNVPLPVGWVQAFQKESELVPSLSQRLEAFHAQRTKQGEVAAALASCDSSSSSSEGELSSGECDRVYAELHARIHRECKHLRATRRQA
eukprot:s563_g8.t2